MSLGIFTDGRDTGALAKLVTRPVQELHFTLKVLLMNSYDTLELLAIALVAAFSEAPAPKLQPMGGTGTLPDWITSIPVANPRPYESHGNWR
jgi:hypothetical protein